MIWVPREFHARLKRHANAEHRTISQFGRLLWEVGLARLEQQQEKREDSR